MIFEGFFFGGESLKAKNIQWLLLNLTLWSQVRHVYKRRISRDIPLIEPAWKRYGVKSVDGEGRGEKAIALWRHLTPSWSFNSRGLTHSGRVKKKERWRPLENTRGMKNYCEKTPSFLTAKGLYLDDQSGCVHLNFS